MNFCGLGHINVVVDDIDVATEFYTRVLSAIPQQDFPYFKNAGFSKAAGFLDEPESVNVSIRFLEIPGTPVFLELMQYHSPISESYIRDKKVNDIGGVGHICLRVNDIDNAFTFIKKQSDVKLVSVSNEYKPFKIDPITPDEFYFFDASKNNKVEKDNVCNVIGEIRFFYFLDPYGIQWEFEQGHVDISS
ncbi:bleomycin resistance protein [Edwardsiella ictaluri]|uniref:VOC family protein n=1 Tax=Edwardsiella ictaluri TaxID=67780 RepID=UPI0009BE636E|nr:VOC family protein [Edwardsiella ictaluri]ARD39382.1 bleomycin resistance protein [Edwardsiella ictaluri]QPW27806.1 bleomycin resistance protein [Edwardsiella ictaluri]